MDLPTKSSYGTSALVTAFGALTISQWTAVVGIILGVATFAINVWFKKKMLDKTEEHYRKTREIQEEHYENQDGQHNQD